MSYSWQVVGSDLLCLFANVAIVIGVISMVVVLIVLVLLVLGRVIGDGAAT